MYTGSCKVSYSSDTRHLTPYGWGTTLGISNVFKMYITKILARVLRNWDGCYSPRQVKGMGTYTRPESLWPTEGFNVMFPINGTDRESYERKVKTEGTILLWVHCYLSNPYPRDQESGSSSGLLVRSETLLGSESVLDWRGVLSEVHSWWRTWVSYSLLITQTEIQTSANNMTLFMNLVSKNN